MLEGIHVGNGIKNKKIAVKYYQKGLRNMKIVRSADREIIPASHEKPESPGVFKKVILQAADFIDGRIKMINWALLPTG